tara:strand:+ start:869 stop:1303 length:435 start_codon:yes stop_codon:yes gene_type:complete
MRRILTVLLLVSGTGAARAVPVVPNFSQGSMTSHTETSQQVTETINSINYNTGYQYVITGTNMEHDGETISAPSITTGTNTVDGVTSTWTGIDLSNKPNFTITTPGAAFQYTESYTGPGMATQTIIQRETNVQSVTDTVSTFSQ